MPFQVCTPCVWCIIIRINYFYTGLKRLPWQYFTYAIFHNLFRFCNIILRILNWFSTYFSFLSAWKLVFQCKVINTYDPQICFNGKFVDSICKSTEFETTKSKTLQGLEIKHTFIPIDNLKYHLKPAFTTL